MVTLLGLGERPLRRGRQDFRFRRQESVLSVGEAVLSNSISTRPLLTDESAVCAVVTNVMLLMTSSYPFRSERFAVMAPSLFCGIATAM